MADPVYDPTGCFTCRGLRSMLDEDELLGDVLPATPVVPNVLYTIGASSEDETATVGARSNEGTFIGTSQ